MFDLFEGGDQAERYYLTCSNTLSKKLLIWVPEDSIDTGNKIVKHNSTISDSLDLTDQLSPNGIKTLSMGPQFIPKDNKTVNEKLHKNLETWGEELFKNLTVKPYRKDELTHLRNIDNIKRKKNINKKKADKSNSMVNLTREQYIKMRHKYLEKRGISDIK